MNENIEQFIDKNIDLLVRECTEDQENLLGLPYPFSIPSENHFEELYYWDTYFTNLGLILMGKFKQAKNNTDDMLYLVDRFGFMPNASRKTFLNRSQPPFLSLMVQDIYEVTKDKEWLKSAYETLKKEHCFWSEKRSTVTGLNRYRGFATEEEAHYLAERFRERTGLSPENSELDTARHMRLCFESGWDINPRWGQRGFEFNHIDLNSVLYAAEMCMSDFAKELGNGEENEWLEKAQNRKALMRKYMKTEKGYFTDYNFVRDEFSDVFSAPSFYPLFAGLADEEEAKATVAMLPRLEYEYGIVSCEKNPKEGNYQWNYPNGWSPIQYLVYRALKNYGYDEEAERIAKKYIILVEKVYAETGNLWEKYNVVEGNIKVNTESPMPPMMGWSAGVYIKLKRELEA